MSRLVELSYYINCEYRGAFVKTKGLQNVILTEKDIRILECMTKIGVMYEIGWLSPVTPVEGKVIMKVFSEAETEAYRNFNSEGMPNIYKKLTKSDMFIIISKLLNKTIITEREARTISEIYNSVVISDYVGIEELSKQYPELIHPVIMGYTSQKFSIDDFENVIKKISKVSDINEPGKDKHSNILTVLFDLDTEEREKYIEVCVKYGGNVRKAYDLMLSN